MSLDLLCPNCRRPIGVADSDDNYKHKYLYSNNKGEPICPSCGTGEEGEGCLFLGIIAAIIIVIVGVIATLVWGIKSTMNSLL